MSIEFDDTSQYAIGITGNVLTSATGAYFRWSEIVLAALRSTGMLDTMVDGDTPPVDTAVLWLDKTTDPAVVKRYDGATWVALDYAWFRKSGIQDTSPYVIVNAGQSNSAGANNGGPNPANPLVRTWDAVTGAWGGSDYTALPWTRSNPDGNSGNNNYALSRAHYIADTTGRPVYIIHDATGGTSIDAWVAAGNSSVRYAALIGKVAAAFSKPELAGVTTIDELIWAQGEEDYQDSFATHLGNLVLLVDQLRAEAWCKDETPIYMMGPSDLHDRYQWQNAMRHFCSAKDNRCMYVPSNGLKTVYGETGTGDFTHFLGVSLWEAGYYRIADASPVEVSPPLFYGRGNGIASPAEPTVLATFSSLVSFDSWTVGTSAPNGPAATGSISWGYQCVADGNYSYAFGHTCETDNASNYGAVIGRNVTTTATCDYFLGGGRDISLEANHVFGAGRGHTIADEGGAAVGTYSEYDAAEADDVIFQVGIGATGASRKNGLTVRKSGEIEMKNLPMYADNAAAVAGGLSVGTLYVMTATANIRVVV